VVDVAESLPEHTVEEGRGLARWRCPVVGHGAAGHRTVSHGVVLIHRYCRFRGWVFMIRPSRRSVV
jgi:hypothetical protein